MNDGFIVLNRRISSWRWWGNPIATALWLYILIEANWQARWTADGSELVGRGELITSQVKIADHFSINKRTVKKYLEAFEKDGQISLDVNNRRTKITVINYGKYQDCFTDNAQPNAQLTAQQDAQQNAQLSAHNRTNITKKQRNNSVFTPPTVDEVQAYITEKGYTVDAERFVDYYTANGWKVGRSKMVDWRRTVNNWQRNEKPQKTNPEYTQKKDEQASAQELAEARAMLERLKHD